MIFCSYFLYRELTLRIEKKNGESIGTITFKKRSASRRYTDNVIWEEIEQESEIFNYDAIRTMEYSSAVISLKDGTKIELDQNTLLVVILSDKGLDINFNQGGVSAESGSGSAGPITLNSKDATIALDKGGMSVNSSDAGINIQVNSGNAKVAVEGKELNITSNETATLKNGEAESKKNSLFPELPKNNSYLVTYGKTLSVRLSWRSDTPGETRVEISRNSDFKNIFKSYVSVKSAVDINLNAGDYYWRLARGNTVSHPVKFTILSDSKPLLISPYPGQKLKIAEDTNLVTFRWEKSQYAPAYELIVAKDRIMTDKVLTLTSKVNIISVPGLKPGKYFWRVRCIYPPEILSEVAFSDTDFFDLEKITFSQVKPVPLDQGPISTAGSFNLHWKGVPGTKSYNVEISTDEKFINIIAEKKTSETFIKIDQKITEGRYYWRVSALSRENISSTSITASLTLIKPLPIVALTPSAGEVISGRPSSINFSWRDPNSGDSYLLEISDRSDFRSIKQSIMSTASVVELKTPVEGDYFWRVLLKDSSGRIVTQSSTREFVIPGELKTPELVYPKDNEKIIPGLKKRFRFEWVRTAGANEYEIEIYFRIAGVEKPLTIYTSRVNYIEITNPAIFSPGLYSWRIKAKQMKSGKLSAYKESKKSFFEVEEVVLLPAPVVKNPGVIFK